MAGNVLGIGYSLSNEDDYGFKTLPARLDEAEGLGVEFVELPLYTMDLIAGGRILSDRLKTAKAILANRNLRYTVHGSLGVNLMDAPERMAKHRKVLQASLEISAELGAVHYVQHTGYMRDSTLADIEARYAQQREILASLGDEAEKLGFLIVVENLFSPGLARQTPQPAGSVPRTALPSRLAREVAAVAHPRIWACLDFSHGAINAADYSADFFSESAALAPYAKHLHVHDSFGRPAMTEMLLRSERLAYGEGDLHLPLGLGDLPWEALMQRLDFPGGIVFNLELAPPYRADLADCIATMRRLAGMARTGL